MAVSLVVELPVEPVVDPVVVVALGVAVVVVGTGSVVVVSPLGVKLCRPSEAVLDLLPAHASGSFAKEDGEVVIDAAGNRVQPGSPT